MKKLIFVRHGKAEENDTAPSDFMRSLTAKGKDISGQMARRLAKREKGDVMIITSPAFRALETALIFADALKSGYDKVLLREAIYGPLGLDNLCLLLREAGDDNSCIILFGHNPSFSLLVNHFSGSNRGFMPKSGVACFGFDTDKWADISRKNSRLLYFLHPDGTDE
ncbi:MAG: histidine phosphatase family protein [Bacteroidales bacterium]|nr:histidine phosphatase family protein [Bacteroidales bacterium]